MRLVELSSRSKKSISLTRADLMNLTQSKETIMKNLRKRTSTFKMRLITTATCLRRLLKDWYKPRPDLSKTILSNALNIWKKKEPLFLREKRILNFKQMKWTYLSLRQEKDFSTELSRTMLKSSKPKRTLLIFVESLRLTKETLKKSNKTFKRKNLMRMKLKSMKFFIRKRRKSMISCKASKMRKWPMNNKSLLISRLSLLSLSTCKRIWPGKISFPLLLNTGIKKMT